MEKFFDLSFSRQPDRSVRLVQDDRMGEAAIIDLHLEQILFIARQLCGMKPETAHKVAELERRIAVLTDKLQNIVCNKAFRSDLIEGLGDGFEYLAKLDSIVDLALEFDGGRLEPELKEAHEDDDKPIYPCSAITQAKKTQPSATVEADGQLGPEV